MTKEAIIEKTVKTLQDLPADKVEEVADFVNYIMKKHEDSELQDGLQQLVQDSNAFNFLSGDEDLYTIEDVKKKFNA
jgi:phosphoserine phosphatase